MNHRDRLRIFCQRSCCVEQSASLFALARHLKGTFWEEETRHFSFILPTDCTSAADSSADSIGHVTALLHVAGHGGGAPSAEEQQTRNRPNCTDHHESTHEND